MAMIVCANSPNIVIKFVSDLWQVNNFISDLWQVNDFVSDFWQAGGFL